ncbi:hypothetical protein B5S29_g710 [[Candida] boidinii]|nr:hypothetical protein B5S29_g710 [[Candida] boidinii]
MKFINSDELIDKLNTNSNYRYDFSKLLKYNPQLEKYVIKNDKINDRIIYDFSKNENNIEFTQSVLKLYFNLDIKIENDRLCPRIPNRLKYVDLMYTLLKTTELNTDSDDYIGLDIGTGHVCIYSLLLYQKYKIKSIGTDIDVKSIELAQTNLFLNNIKDEDIALIINEDSNDLNMYHSLFERIVKEKNSYIGFTVCNPPFYESQLDLDTAKSNKTNNPNTLDLVGTDLELFTKGGELEFIGRLIDDSCSINLKTDKFKWFSSMINKYSNLPKVVEHLKTKKIWNFGIFELSFKDFESKPVYHSSTSRWVVYWSFQNFIPPYQISRLKHSNLKFVNPPLSEFVIVNKTDKSFILKELALLNYIKLTASEDKKYVRFEAPDMVWSRSYRRSLKGNKRQKISNEESQVLTLKEPTVIDIIITDSSIKIHWRYGASYKIYESFTSWLKRKSDENK